MSFNIVEHGSRKRLNKMPREQKSQQLAGVQVWPSLIGLKYVIYVKQIGETGAHWDKKYILLNISIMNKQFEIPSIPVCTSI